MSRRRVKFLRTLAQAGGSLDRIIPRDCPWDARENIVAFRRAVSLAPQDDTLTRWLRWKSEADLSKRGKR